MRWRALIPFALVAMLPAAVVADSPGRSVPDWLETSAASSVLESLQDRGKPPVDVGVKIDQLDFYSAKGAEASSGRRFAQPVPEPGTGLMLLLGLGALALRRRQAA